MDLSIAIATVNGSGSQSANAILAKSIFRMGHRPGVHNIFPSNISGLPSWTYLRVSDKGYSTRRTHHQIVISRNAETWEQDLKQLSSNGVLLYDQGLKVDFSKIPNGIRAHAIPFRELVLNASESVKMRKLLSNMVYLGILQELLQIPANLLEQTIHDQFHHRENVISPNIKALQSGRDFTHQHLREICTEDLKLSPVANVSKERIFIDGNSAAALGAVVGGCTFLSWYPITPATSLAESFQSYCDKMRSHENGKLKSAILQAEDELSAISAVIGAGWMGARAMTSTSGPGLSLMSEAAGLSYFAEIPAVIWNVQRAGPSTGLPTRTMQADIAAAATLSHGDTKHVLLFPGDPNECYEFAQIAFDLADRLQTLVICLSDLDLGMNFRVATQFQMPTQKYDRGKLVKSGEANPSDNFERYQDVDNDGICYRTLPGSESVAYFARGTAHTPFATYSEDPDNFKSLLLRLQKKWETAKTLVPSPIVETEPASEICLVSYGSTMHGITEIRDLLSREKIKTSHLRLRSYPFSNEVKGVLASHKKIIVIEQNRDGQMQSLLAQEFPEYAEKLRSVTNFDGMPICAATIADSALRQVNHV